MTRATSDIEHSTQQGVLLKIKAAEGRLQDDSGPVVTSDDKSNVGHRTQHPTKAALLPGCCLAAAWMLPGCCRAAAGLLSGCLAAGWLLPGCCQTAAAAWLLRLAASGCCLAAAWLLSGCCLAAAWLLFGCCRAAAGLLPDCCLAAAWLLSGCCRAAVELLSGCLAAAWLLPGCCRAAAWLLPGCCLAAAWESVFPYILERFLSPPLDPPPPRFRRSLSSFRYLCALPPPQRSKVKITSKPYQYQL